MIKKFAYLIFSILNILNILLEFVFKKNFLIYLNEFVDKKLYIKKKILDKSLIFFCPNSLIKWRVESFFSKEPGTLEWIDKFDNKKNNIFWDIGSNIGLYSIYNSIKNNKTKTISFEPSNLNLRVLSKNISLNNLSKRIHIFTLPLSNKTNKFLAMKQGNSLEGGALNTFGEKFDFEGKNYKAKMNYFLMGTSINYLLENKILETPDYIKIDVDGIEHLILEGANKFLKNKKIKSINIELNENFVEQFEKVKKIMKKNNFKFKKKYNELFSLSNNKFSKTYNYIYFR